MFYHSFYLYFYHHQDKTSEILKTTEGQVSKRKHVDNGVSKIKRLLECAESRITAVRAGQPLSACLDKEKRLQVCYLRE